MKQQELIDFVNGSYFISLKECKENIKLNPVYENFTNIIDLGRFKIGSLIYKCEDGDVNIRGMINNFKEWHEDSVGYVIATKYVSLS